MKFRNCLARTQAAVFLLTLPLLVSCETCADLQLEKGTLYGQPVTASLEENGYVATFNDIPLEQLNTFTIEVGSPYVFEISHNDATMEGRLEFELQWSPIIHSYYYDTFEIINGTLRAVGPTSLRLVVGVDSPDQTQCITYGSSLYTFEVLPRNDTLLLDDVGTHHACNICGFPDTEASSTPVLHPDYLQERPCDEWQNFGFEGRLTHHACNFVLNNPSLAGPCGCRHVTTSSAGRLGGSVAHFAWITMMTMILGSVLQPQIF